MEKEKKFDKATIFLIIISIFLIIYSYKAGVNDGYFNGFSDCCDDKSIGFDNVEGEFFCFSNEKNNIYFEGGVE